MHARKQNSESEMKSRTTMLNWKKPNAESHNSEASLEARTPNLGKLVAYTTPQTLVRERRLHREQIGCSILKRS